VLAAVAAGCIFSVCVTPAAIGTDVHHGAAAAQPAGDLGEFIRLYTTDRNGVQRFHGLPWCEESLDRRAALTADWRAKLAALDFSILDQHGKVDYVLMETELNAEDARTERERGQIREMDAALPFRRAVLELELARRRMDGVDPEGAAARLAKIPDQIKDARERIKKDKSASDAIALTPVVARRASRAADELRGTLSEWFEYHDSFKPDFAWWVSKPYRQANEAIESYARFLREEIAGLHGKDDDPLIGDPIGAEGLKEDLAAEMMVYTPQELIDIAEQQFAWCEAEMKKASSEMGLGDDWKAALEKVKNDHVAPGEQDVLVKQLAQGAIDFVQSRDLVTIPDLCKETWRIEMLSTQTQKTLPFAVYGGQHIGVSYATEEMTHADKEMSMRGNNRHFTRIVVPHELIPGHHLQGFMAQRSRPYRGIFYTPFFVEGWAVYWEMTLWDLGYQQSPEDRIGMLFWRMHRCARIIVSLKFHLGEMTPSQMVDFLVDRVGHERFGATSEVRRYIGGDYSPLYQCGYMVGALQLRSLYKELVGSGKMTPKQFNDAVLACNAVSIEMVRAELEGSELTPGWKPGWRFGDPEK
jgi:uncharacterized protein (DUF885 family)